MRGSVSVALAPKEPTLLRLRAVSPVRLDARCPPALLSGDFHPAAPLRRLVQTPTPLHSQTRCHSERAGQAQAHRARPPAAKEFPTAESPRTGSPLVVSQHRQYRTPCRPPNSLVPRPLQTERSPSPLAPPPVCQRAAFPILGPQGEEASLPCSRRDCQSSRLEELLSP